MRAGWAYVPMVLVCLVSGGTARTRHGRGELGGLMGPGHMVNIILLRRHNYKKVTGLPGGPWSPGHSATEGGPAWPRRRGGDEGNLDTMESLDYMLEGILLRRQRQLRKKARKLRRLMVTGDLIPHPRTG